jgi:hypothetical protein
MPRILVICFFSREEFLIPFFLSHYQRRHGDPSYHSPGSVGCSKPSIFRSNRGVQLTLGNRQMAEQFVPPVSVSTPGLRIVFAHHQPGVPVVVSDVYGFDGAHGQNADPSFCAARRLRDRRDRQGADNLRPGLGIEHHFITEADLAFLFKETQHLPQLFETDEGGSFPRMVTCRA